MWRFDYSAQLTFIGPAMGKAQVWRTLVGFILIMGVLTGLGPLIYLAIFDVFDQWIEAQGVVEVFATLFGFGALTLGVFATLYFVHDRFAGTFFGTLNVAVD